MNIEISSWTIVKTLLIIFAMAIAYYIKDIIAMIFIAFMFSTLIDPLADWFEAKKIPRALAVILIYVFLLGIFAGILFLLVPPVMLQVREFVRDFGGYWERVSSSFVWFEKWGAEKGILENIERSVQSMDMAIGNAFAGIVGTVSGFVGGIVAFIVILVITFYMVVEEEALKRILRNIVPNKNIPYFTERLTMVKRKLGDWLRGQMILMLIIGVFVYVGLSILGVDYALVLGVFAGLMEIVPYAGPILGAIPAVFLALADSPVKALIVIILYFVIQQVENHLLVPKVMQKAIGLNPVISIIALLIGAKIAGFVGILLAIPVTTAASVFLKDFFYSND